MNTVIILATMLITAPRPPAPPAMCPASDWRPSGVVGVQVRDLKVCK